MNEKFRKLILVLLVVPLVASSNIDCNGKSFHCVNSTHFMICVDLGGGVSSTIDDFTIPCPPSTMCQSTNFFECEFSLPITIDTSASTVSYPSEITTDWVTSVGSTTVSQLATEVPLTETTTVSITTPPAQSVTNNEVIKSTTDVTVIIVEDLITTTKLPTEILVDVVLTSQGENVTKTVIPEITTENPYSVGNIFATNISDSIIEGFTSETYLPTTENVLDNFSTQQNNIYAQGRVQEITTKPVTNYYNTGQDTTSPPTDTLTTAITDNYAAVEELSIFPSIQPTMPAMAITGDNSRQRKISDTTDAATITITDSYNGKQNLSTDPLTGLPPITRSDNSATGQVILKASSTETIVRPISDNIFNIGQDLLVSQTTETPVTTITENNNTVEQELSNAHANMFNIQGDLLKTPPKPFPPVFPTETSTGMVIINVTDNYDERQSLSSMPGSEDPGTTILMVTDSYTAGQDLSINTTADNYTFATPTEIPTISITNHYIAEQKFTETSITEKPIFTDIYGSDLLSSLAGMPTMTITENYGTSEYTSTATTTGTEMPILTRNDSYATRQDVPITRSTEPRMISIASTEKIQLATETGTSTQIITDIYINRQDTTTAITKEMGVPTITSTVKDAATQDKSTDVSGRPTMTIADIYATGQDISTATPIGTENPLTDITDIYNTGSDNNLSTATTIGTENPSITEISAARQDIMTTESATVTGLPVITITDKQAQAQDMSTATSPEMPSLAVRDDNPTTQNITTATTTATEDPTVAITDINNITGYDISTTPNTEIENSAITTTNIDYIIGKDDLQKLPAKGTEMPLITFNDNKRQNTLTTSNIGTENPTLSNNDIYFTEQYLSTATTIEISKPTISITDFYTIGQAISTVTGPGTELPLITNTDSYATGQDILTKIATGTEMTTININNNFTVGQDMPTGTEIEKPVEIVTNNYATGQNTLTTTSTEAERHTMSIISDNYSAGLSTIYISTSTSKGTEISTTPTNGVYVPREDISTITATITEKPTINNNYTSGQNTLKTTANKTAKTTIAINDNYGIRQDISTGTGTSSTTINDNYNTRQEISTTAGIEIPSTTIYSNYAKGEDISTATTILETAIPTITVNDYYITSKYISTATTRQKSITDDAGQELLRSPTVGPSTTTFTTNYNSEQKISPALPISDNSKKEIQTTSAIEKSVTATDTYITGQELHTKQSTAETTVKDVNKYNEEKELPSALPTPLQTVTTFYEFEKEPTKPISTGTPAMDVFDNSSGHKLSTAETVTLAQDYTVTPSIGIPTVTFSDNYTTRQDISTVTTSGLENPAVTIVNKLDTHNLSTAAPTGISAKKISDNLPTKYPIETQPSTVTDSYTVRQESPPVSPQDGLVITSTDNYNYVMARQNNPSTTESVATKSYTVGQDFPSASPQEMPTITASENYNTKPNFAKLPSTNKTQTITNTNRQDFTRPAPTETVAIPLTVNDNRHEFVRSKSVETPAVTFRDNNVVIHNLTSTSSNEIHIRTTLDIRQNLPRSISTDAPIVITAENYAANSFNPVITNEAPKITITEPTSTLDDTKNTVASFVHEVKTTHTQVNMTTILRNNSNMPNAKITFDERTLSGSSWKDESSQKQFTETNLDQLTSSERSLEEEIVTELQNGEISPRKSPISVTTFKDDLATERQHDLTTTSKFTTKPKELPVTSSLDQNKTNIDLNDQIKSSILKSYCQNRTRGRYSDHKDCNKFYICIGKNEPIVGNCPVNTVFSDLKKQCTKNKSHCIRQNQFKCVSEGRFSNIFKNNVYYICVKRINTYIRFQFQCQNGYHLNETSVKCVKDELHKESASNERNSETVPKDKNSEISVSKNSKEHRDNKADKKSKKEHRHDFVCSKEGKFVDPHSCKKYYVCTKSNKSEFRRRRKSCDSGEVFHQDKRKCVDSDSYEC